jgi:hypothetical protein
LSGLRIESLLGTGAQPAFRQDEPELQVTVTRDNGDVLSYRFSRPQEGAYYVLKRSDFDHYFKVAEFTVQPVKDTSRETLVQTRTVEVPAQATSDESDTGIPTETAAMGE